MNTILLLVKDQQKLTLLDNWLQDSYKILTPQPDLNINAQINILLQQPFDLCVIDNSFFTQLETEFLSFKQAQTVLLPIILVALPDEIERLSLSQQELVDDLIELPANHNTLNRRINILMRSRNLSAQLSVAKQKIDRALLQEKQLNLLKSNLVEMVSHECLTPLNSMSEMMQLFEIYGDNLAVEKKKKIYQRLQQNIEKMSHALEEVSFVAKASLGKLQFQPDLLNLKSFCENIIHELKLGFNPTRRLNFSYRGETITVADQKLLRYILINLLGNAFKYSPDESEIEFLVITNQYQIVFMVQDQGIGIPLADQNRLFESFYRASNVGKVPGIGLGLAIVKQCVDLHQGAIAFESKPEIGTTFTVMLPHQSPMSPTLELQHGCRL